MYVTVKIIAQLNLQINLGKYNSPRQIEDLNIYSTTRNLASFPLPCTWIFFGSCVEFYHVDDGRN